MPSDGELTVYLLVAAGLGGLLGAEREFTGQPAGMRTHVLVGVGAALFAAISAFGYQSIVGGAGANVQVDVSRVTAGIVAGIGFLGAGAILKYGASIRGLTTAASLWVTAAVGAAAGTGKLALAAAATGIVLAALVGLRPVRSRLRDMARGPTNLTIVAEPDAELSAVVRDVEESGVIIREVRVGEEAEGGLQLVVRVPPGSPPGILAAELVAKPGIRDIDWS